MPGNSEMRVLKIKTKRKTEQILFKIQSVEIEIRARLAGCQKLSHISEIFA